MATEKLLSLFLLSTVVVDGFNGDSCRVGKFSTTDKVPQGGLKVDGIEVLARGKAGQPTVSAEYCISQCCQLGPDDCQYMWVIWGSCFAVSCQSESDSCDPVPLKSSSLYPSFSNIESVYVEMLFHNKSSTRPTPTERTFGSLQGEEDRTELNGVEQDGAADQDIVTVDGAVDALPVARAGGDVLVVLPQTTATLYGNRSTDDKGIVYYLWQLTAEDHMSNARVLDPTSPVAQVVDLSPGTYTFALTVVDTSYQSSTNKVLVRVLAGPREVPKGVASTGNLRKAHWTESINSSMADAEVEDMSYSKKRLLMKILMPVLVLLLIILLLSAAIVLLFACLCDRKKRKRHLYRYRQLTAIEET